MKNCGICHSNLHILGIEHLPTTECEIKQAYRDGAKVWHPDRFQGEPRLAKKAEEQFKRVQSAYQQLTEHTGLHGNYGSTNDETRSPRPKESPRQQPSASPVQLERVLSAIKRRTDGRRFFDESRLPPEIAKTAKQILPDYSKRLLGVVDTSKTAGTMGAFLAFFDGGVAYRRHEEYSSARITDYATLADFEMTPGAIFGWLTGAESNMSIWLGGERIGERLNGEELERLSKLLVDLQWVVRSPNYVAKRW